MVEFDAGDLAAIAATKYLYIRAGPRHRFIAVWVVVADGRVFLRSWNDKADGWFRAFLSEQTGAIRLGDRELSVVAKKVSADSVLDAVTRGFAAKYTTKPNRKYVKGFAEPSRRANTLELLPGK